MMPAAMKTLLFRLNLKKWIENLRGLPPVLRTGVLALSGFLLLLLLYLAVVEPLINLENAWSEDLSRKEQILTHYQALLANKEKFAAHVQSLQSTLAATNKQMLSGGNPAVAAADLQEILKNLLKTAGAQSLAIKVLPPKERGSYQEVPILIQLTANIEQLFNILYDLEHNQKLLVVTELNINVSRSEAMKEEIPNLRADLIVAGMIKKGVAS
jgi:type II secretory pathway component PulM